MSVLFYALAFVIVLGPLVFVHELGHFLAAKMFGVRVEVFSLGFGPRLFGVRRGDTDYRVAPIPLGGYVRMSGEYAPAEDAADPALLTNKPRWQRLVIMAAGPAVNVAFAWLVLWGLLMYGTTTYDIPDGVPVVGAVVEGSGAERAGIRPGDRILAVAGTELGSLDDLLQEVTFRPGQTVPYEIERDGARIVLDVRIDRAEREEMGVPGILAQLPIAFGAILEGGAAADAGLQSGDRLLSVDGATPGQVGELVALIQGSADVPLEMTVMRAEETVRLTVVPRADESGAGKIGAELGPPRRFVRFGPVAAAGQAFETLRWQSGMLYRALKALVTRELGLSALSGPLEIARISGEFVRVGWLEVLTLMAALSLQLGLLNLLPIPVLDGGQIVLLLVEGARGRDLTPSVREKILITGFVMIVLLMVTVIGLDVLKLSRSLSREPAPVEAPAQPGEE